MPMRCIMRQAYESTQGSLRACWKKRFDFVMPPWHNRRMTTPSTGHLPPAIGTILADIMEEGERLSGRDDLFSDDEFEVLLPKVARRLLAYADAETNPEERVIQVFDILTRWVLDPTLIPTPDDPDHEEG